MGVGAASGDAQIGLGVTIAEPAISRAFQASAVAALPGS